MDALRTLGALTQVLRVRWYLFGAQAAVLWGRARTTADVDVTMEADPERIAELLREAKALGLRAREANAVELARRSRVVPLTTAGGFPIDLVLAGTGLEAQFMDRATPVRLGGVEVPVISPEDLVITKLIAGRPRDLEDIEGVLVERRESLDVGYIDAMIREIESALELDGLRSAWDELLQTTGLRR
ncbi:MAG: nucleotidyltransferase [Deltaproteobacteria bacterium]|nr:nucleotidyltransferase [Deltaproteobacteria bacterium]